MPIEKVFYQRNTMADKYLKRYLTSLVCPKMQFRPQQDPIFFTTLAKVKRMKVTYVAEKERAECPLLNTCGNIKWYNFWKGDHSIKSTYAWTTTPSLWKFILQWHTQRNTYKDVHQFLDVVKRNRSNLKYACRETVYIKRQQYKIKAWDFPGGPVAKVSLSPCRRPGFYPWSGN